MFGRMLGCAVAAVLVVAPCSADVILFENITNNDAGNAAIGELQLSMSLIDAGPGLVEFSLLNSGPEQSCIGQIYFDGDLVTGLDSIIDGAGTSFSEGGSPANLPGGNGIGFVSDLMASADNPAPLNGAGPGEGVSLVLTVGGSFDEVLGAIDSGDLRVGLHVISFANGGSEGFVNAVPAPGVLTSLAAAALIGRRRRRS